VVSVDHAGRFCPFTSVFLPVSPPYARGFLESSWPWSGLQIEINVHEMEDGSAGTGRLARSFGFLWFDFWIKQMEVKDLNFEFVFHECLRHDGSGEKGFEA
jgi:hypothetical protein